jgi:hypothetical protein
VEEDKMDVASSMHWSDEESYKIFPENPKGRDRLEELSIHASIMLKWVLRK